MRPVTVPLSLRTDFKKLSSSSALPLNLQCSLPVFEHLLNAI